MENTVQVLKGKGSTVRVNATIRVGAYCRVSTDMEEQQSSLDLQIKSFTSQISMRPGWKMVEIYAEEERSYPALFYSQIENHFILMNDLYSDTIIK